MRQIHLVTLQYIIIYTQNNTLITYDIDVAADPLRVLNCSFKKSVIFKLSLNKSESEMSY